MLTASEQSIIKAIGAGGVSASAIKSKVRGNKLFKNKSGERDTSISTDALQGLIDKGKIVLKDKAYHSRL